MKIDTYRAGVAFAAVSAILWAVGNLLPGVMTWDAWSILFVRGAVGLLAVAIYLAVKKESLFGSDPWEWYAGVCLALLSASVYLSIKMGSVAVAMVLMYTSPNFSALFEHFTRKRLGKLVWLALTVSLLGIVCVKLDGFKPISALAFICGIVAGLAYALWGECHQRMRDKHSSRGVLYGYLISAVTAAPMFVYYLPQLDLSAEETGKAVATGLAHVAAYIMLVAAFARIPTFVALVIAALEVPLVALAASYFAGENPGYLALIGGLLILGANIYLTWRMNPVPKSSAA